ncbi:MAG: DegT/DnrJ/EryC1/StrS family aminotransferase [Myxococcales bacterium]|nr:DegT/DnrJ/EryC1/StrS family aminotransferase [Myxococcales bacterium]
MKVPLLDLARTHAPIRDELDRAFARVVDSETFILGPEVRELEREILAFIGGGAHAAVGCASGSDAILLALRALGVGPGDEVIVPAFSFTSTATYVDLTGARCVFVDVEPETLNISPTAIAAALTDKTRAILAVHLFGRPADIPAIRCTLDAAGANDVAIVEDAAQALGASLDGHAVGTLGDLATFSFFPTKNLGAFGDGGMVICRRGEQEGILRTLGAHGAREKYKAEVVGYNSRLDALQAAILRVKLPHLRAWCDTRRENAAWYRQAFGRRLGPSLVRALDGDGADGRAHHIYNQFVVRAVRRDELLAHLHERGIGAAVYYPRTLPQQPCFAALGLSDAAFPVASAAATDSVALPVYPGLTAAEREAVVDAVCSFYGE